MRKHKRHNRYPGISVNMPPEMVAAAKDAASAEDLPLAAWIRRAVREKLARAAAKQGEAA